MKPLQSEEGKYMRELCNSQNPDCKVRYTATTHAILPLR